MSDCQGEQLTLLRKQGADLKSESLIQLVNGNFLIGGSEDGESLIVEVTADGEPVWAGRVDVLPSNEMIFSMQRDLEGNILCIGADAGVLTRCYIIKLDPTGRSIRWISAMDDVDLAVMYTLDIGTGSPYYVFRA